MNNLMLTGTVKDGVNYNMSANGTPIARLTLVVPRKSGKGKDFFRVTFWRDLASKAEAEIIDGMAIGVSGPMTNDRYEKDGAWRDSWTVHATEFEILTGAAPAGAGALDTEAGW